MAGDNAGGDVDHDSLIERLDPAIFALETQTTRNDRIALLRLQRLVRRASDAYGYLEVGSYRGGSLLPHLADPRCGLAVSIDPRPPRQPDNRRSAFTYDDNSTARMIEGLRGHLPPTSLRKLQTFDLDARDVPRGAIARPIHLVLIDGEHTTVAAFSDVLSVLPFLAPDAIVAYHDANLLTDAIRNVERFLAYSAIPFCTVFLPDFVAAIALRGMADALVQAVGAAALDQRQDQFRARRGLQETVALEVVKDLGLVTTLWRAGRARLGR